jgi:hypothetical protein
MQMKSAAVKRVVGQALGLGLALLLTVPAQAKDAKPAAKTAAPAAAAAEPVTDPAGNSMADILKLFQIGGPMPDLPDCADQRTSDGLDVKAFCVEVRGDGQMRQIGIPRDKRPAFMDGPSALAVVDQNALVGLIVPTDGARSEKTTVQSLSAAFGKPFRQETEKAKDNTGKVVDVIHAGWKWKALTVELYAMPDDPKTGTIEMLLPKARTLMAQRDADMAQALSPEAASSPKAAPAKPAAKTEHKKGTW